MVVGAYYMRRAADGGVAIYHRRNGDEAIATVHKDGLVEAMELAERIVKFLNSDANVSTV